jgi:hypothetical protein
MILSIKEQCLEFFKIFVEQPVFAIETLVMNTPESQLEALKQGNFYLNINHMSVISVIKQLIDVQNNSLVMDT